jgi:hypothetical protein
MSVCVIQRCTTCSFSVHGWNTTTISYGSVFIFTSLLLQKGGPSSRISMESKGDVVVDENNLPYHVSAGKHTTSTVRRLSFHHQSKVQ